MGQIKRLYGNLDVFNKLKIIYISHVHADHILGLAAILRECKKNVLLIGPSYIKDYVDYFGYKMNVVTTDSLTLESSINYLSTASLKTLEMDFYKKNQNVPFSELDYKNYIFNFSLDEFEFKICGCPHSRSSTSIFINDICSNHSFSYSGDTIPTPMFAKISQNEDVMIHEGTFHDDQIEHSKKTCHSTLGGANEIFKLSNSKKLLLTHFSNRNSEDKITDTCITDFFR